MPSVKELSQIKAELLYRREKSIKGSLSKQQNDLYDSIITEFVKIAKAKIDGKPYDILALQKKLKQEYNSEFPKLFAEVVRASSSISNLNYQYFSTLVEASGLAIIKSNSEAVINKTLGITDKGKLKAGGFIDKAIENKAVQKSFAKEVTLILEGSPDIGLMQHKIKEFITGTKESTGLLERYYRTFANDLISNIDSTGALIYANELDLNDFLYNGGIILSSRKFCIDKNGKAFTRSQAERWAHTTFIKDMYKNNPSEYQPLISPPGGYGCKHRYDWITLDIAKGYKG